ncbi:HAMP domain-containing histidine kinase [Streptomyces olivaceus]|uniref:histidine kinase n=1 Tax=Streptomyces olivaceus TaxID=47716 RepID=A0ABS7WD01_STROV|nr:two-component sensor histidine kinase [Streptomyces olivaceus]QIP68725.1 HAMP domain-containing histidine kinase [Streptomyces sp. VN1]MBZ6093009.1 HAMP domain-containing histidine kinase [Streptomyces olivaceus]MBZ6099952.1 HAMP domain-containing histidine kinase [Streptomyces olivaceus]MBZ6113880.1 HAMP domain-containing histidine kinase [Streptomyces olivaceus]
MRRRWPRVPSGLRVRLVVAFLLAAAFGALLTAGLTFYRARAAILDRAQETAVADLRTQLDSLAPDLAFPPGTEDLRGLTREIDRAGGARAWHASASYRGGEPVSASRGTPPVPGELRETVQDSGRAAHQRIEHDGRSWLALGMPVSYTGEPGNTGPGKDADSGALSGLTVYAAFPLDDDGADIDALVTAAQTGAVPALALALVPALFAARSVLRPVRRLRHGAERIAAGELDTRLDAEGHDELADLTRSFNTMAETLERDAAELRRLESGARRFAADVAHELRTPLAAMAAVTEVLDEDAASGVLPADTEDAVRLISEEVRILARMVEDLMEVSRFDARAAPVHREDVDLRTLVVKTLQLRGWAHDERVRAVLPERAPVRADPRRIDVVLGNLVANALHHGRPPVTVAVRVHQDQAEVTVADRGPGIPEDVLPYVFERFYKADAARPRTGGSGLGLAIAHENAALHDGSLTAANHPAGGAVFTLTLPLAPPQDASSRGTT